MLGWLIGLKCPECGKKIKESERYCPHCGIDLDEPIEFKVDSAKSKEYFEKAQRMYDKGGSFQVALHNCNMAIHYDPDSAVAHNLRGLILDELRQTDEAIASYQEALRIEPTYEDARANLADAELEQQNKIPEIEQNRKNPWLIGFAGIAGLFVVLSSIACIYFGLAYGLKYLKPKVTIIFIPDHSLVTTVEPSDLEVTAQMLEERSRSFGYTGISFVAEDDQIVGQIPGYIDVQLFVEQVSAIGLVEFVDFGENSFPVGTFVATDYDYSYLAQPDTTKWHTIMTNSELQAVSISENQSGIYAIDFTLTAEGAKIFSDYTTENVGSFLGIVLDKRVISSPMVNSPITEGAGSITGTFTQEEAQSLAVYLKINEPLPIPLTLKQPSNDE